MKTNLIKTIALVLASATPAGAADGIAGGFTGIFLWVFFGYCAIIIVAQTIAALRSLAESGRRQPATPATTENPPA